MQCNYRNYLITKTKAGYKALGLLFPTLPAATDEIDKALA